MKSRLSKQRFHHWDALRGLVIILMMLDHTRHFFSAASFDPTDLTQSTWGWFLTRWVTHFCAPVFVFLAGAGMAMSSRKGLELSKYLWTRGILLIFLELTWVNISWGLWGDSKSVLQVIWVLGSSMIAMSFLFYIPKPILLLFSCVLCLIQLKEPSFLVDYSLEFLFYPQTFNFLNWEVKSWYPIAPWLSLMIMGWCSGRSAWINSQSALISLGTSFCLLFFIGRAVGVMNGWVQGDSVNEILLAILNCQKYPPSLSYLLMTMGPSFIILGCFTGRPSSLIRFLAKVGHYPLFFYLIHLPILAISSSLLDWRGYDDDLLGIYGVWALLLPPCFFLTFFMGFVKKTYPKSFLRYF